MDTTEFKYAGFWIRLWASVIDTLRGLLGGSIEEDLGQNLPAPLRTHQGQKVCEVFGADDALHVCKRRVWPGKLHRQDAVGTRLLPAGR